MANNESDMLCVPSSRCFTTIESLRLNAVGGRPQLDTPQMLPAYPACMPHGDRSFEVSLVHFGPQALETFLKIESPASPHAALFADCGGRVIAVDNLATAIAALEEIVEQGEGADHRQVWDGDRDMFHPEREQVAHYYRLQQLQLGRRYRRGDTPQSGPTGDTIEIDWDGVQPSTTTFPGDAAISILTSEHA